MRQRAVAPYNSNNNGSSIGNTTSNNVHTESSKSIADLSLQLERHFLEYESIVYPELTTASSSDNLLSSDEVRQQIQACLKLIEGMIPNERDPIRRELHKKQLQSGIMRFTELNKVESTRKMVTQRNLNRSNLFSSSSVNNNTRTFDNLAHSAAVKESLTHSARGVEEILYTGGSVLENLKSQSESLKRASGKIDITSNAVGIASSLLRAVKRRQFGDQVIVFGGMFMVTVILYLFYQWVHYK